MSNGTKDGIGATFVIILLIAAVFGTIMLGVSSCGHIKDFNRTQRVKNARNNVKITAVNIQRAQQQAKIARAQIAITKANAEKKFQESVGIRRAQDEIAKTLTPLYVQHEAIQAMERGGASKIYIPSGAQGIPLVNDVSTGGR